MVARRFRTGVKQVSNRISCKEQHRGGLPALQVDSPANDQFGRWVLPLEPDTDLPIGHRPNTPQFALIVFPTVQSRPRQADRPDGLREGCGQVRGGMIAGDAVPTRQNNRPVECNVDEILG
jgi:hypothetical protein